MTPTGLEDELKNTGRTYFLGAKIYISIAVCAVLVVILFSLLVVFSIRYYRKSKKQRMVIKHPSSVMPMISKEIVEIKKEEDVIIDLQEEKKDHGRQTLPNSDDKTFSSNVDSNIGWGRWYTLRELEMATEGFSKENVIGEGGYGIVYKGVLSNNIIVAVKNLFNHKGQAEKEFRVEVEAIGKVRHRNLAGLVGYCADGPQRLLVYEFVDNGNLEQWLHGDVELKRALTWEIRMKIAIGTAKGLAYLHEGLEPKVVHRDIKSSNILLDKQWNPKVSDFGLAKLLRSGSKYVTTRVMGTFGYVAPDYASSGMLNECSDVYSFGVLLMEIISGRIPVDFQRPVGQVNLVEWFKGMVGSRLMEEVVDPCIEVPPSSRVLRRVFLICLRCIDVDASKRPKMGQIVYMLEGDEFPFRSDNRPIRQTSLAIPDARVV